MNKKTIALLIFLLFLTSCTITGKAVEEIKKQPTQQERDLTNLAQAQQEKDVSYCYYIENQPIREECFLSLAQQLNDPSICSNLLGSLKESCLSSLQ